MMAESSRKIQRTSAFCNIRTGTALYFHELEGAEFVINDGKAMGYIKKYKRENECARSEMNDSRSGKKKTGTA